jgi:hypothetical protein
VQRVRLGVFAAAGSALLPRALRAGSIDLAILTSRAPHRSPDQEDPPLHLETLLDVRLALAVPVNGKFGGRVSVTASEVADEPWIASPSSIAEPLRGVWPGLPGRPQVDHSSRDWLTKLELVAARSWDHHGAGRPLTLRAEGCSHHPSRGRRGGGATCQHRSHSGTPEQSGTCRLGRPSKRRRTAASILMLRGRVLTARCRTRGWRRRRVARNLVTEPCGVARQAVSLCSAAPTRRRPVCSNSLCDVFRLSKRGDGVCDAAGSGTAR